MKCYDPDANPLLWLALSVIDVDTLYENVESASMKVFPMQMVHVMRTD